MKLRYLLIAAPLVLAACETEPLNPDGTRGTPGTLDWFTSASPEQERAYFESICRNVDGLSPGTRQMAECASQRRQRAAERNYEVAALQAQLYAQVASRPQQTINVNVDPGPMTCRQFGTLVRCD